MIKWSIELSEFSIDFQARKAIKAQALVDFIAKCSFSNNLEDQKNNPSQKN